jgi:hypothetical protein
MQHDAGSKEKVVATILDEIIELRTLDGFRIDEVIKATAQSPRLRATCTYCGTEQEKAYISFYHFHTGDRLRIPCANEVCNSYRKVGAAGTMPYIEYEAAYKVGCVACGNQVRAINTFCARCRRIVKSEKGADNFRLYIEQVMAHTQQFKTWENNDE